MTEIRIHNYLIKKDPSFLKEIKFIKKSLKSKIKDGHCATCQVLELIV